jgi:L-alanine-DL-glutamate epimerase-like enolase superfamily enzyme
VFQPPEVVDGRIIMSERPGLGLQVDQNLLAEVLKRPGQTA